MDPKQALIDCDQAISDGELDEARDHLADYRQWRERGGFEPIEVAGTLWRGDKFARWCANRIEDYR